MSQRCFVVLSTKFVYDSNIHIGTPHNNSKHFQFVCRKWPVVNLLWRKQTTEKERQDESKHPTYTHEKKRKKNIIESQQTNKQTKQYSYNTKHTHGHKHTHTRTYYINGIQSNVRVSRFYFIWTKQTKKKVHIFSQNLHTPGCPTTLYEGGIFESFIEQIDNNLAFYCLSILYKDISNRYVLRMTIELVRWWYR